MSGRTLDGTTPPQGGGGRGYDVAMAAGAFLVAASAALLFGGVHARPFSVLCAGVAVLGLGLSLRLLLRPGEEVVAPRLWPLPVLLLSLPLWQLVPWPEGWLARLAPAGVEARAALALAYGLPRTGQSSRISLHAGETIKAALALGAPLLLFLAVLQGVRSGRVLRALLLALAVAGTLMAAYALTRHFTANPVILGHHSPYHLSCASGTFVNPNHFASWIVACGLLTLGLLVSQAQRFGERREPHPLASPTVFRASLLALMVAAMLLALVCSRSRMGCLSFAALLVPLACLPDLRKGRWAVLGFAAAVLALVPLWYGGEAILEKFGRSTAEESRLSVWPAAWRLFLAQPWTGHGAGAFGAVFQPHVPAGIAEHGYRFDHAHCEPLEWLVETGLAGAVLVLACLAAYAVAWFRAWRGEEDPARRVPALFALAAALAMLVHAGADFPLRIPANALLLAILLAASLGLLRRRREPRRVRTAGPARHLLAAAVAAVAALLAAQAFRTAAAEALAPSEPDFTAPDRRLALVPADALRRAAELAPGEPLFQRELSARAGRGSSGLEESRGHLFRAADAAPGDAETLAWLACLEWRGGRPRLSARLLELAVAADPTSPRPHLLVGVTMAQWPRRERDRLDLALALARLDEAAARDPSVTRVPPAVLARARALEALGRIPEAIAVLKSVNRLDAETLPLHLTLARLQAGAGDAGAVRRKHAQILEHALPPAALELACADIGARLAERDDPETRLRLCAARLRQDRPAEALRTLAPLLETARGRTAARARVQAGRASERLGERGAARSHYLKALEADPHFPEAVEAAGRLLRAP